jgi:hypothetical protein
MLIPITIVGTYSVAVNSVDIKENTKFRVKSEKTIDSLLIQLRLEKKINTIHRDFIKDEIIIDTVK